MRIILKIASGPASGQILWLGPQQSIVVGRTERAEFAVPGDPQLSSRHFQVAWNDSQFCIRDLNSTNGTTVNGVRIQEAVLQSGDVVVAGQSSFEISIELDNAAPSQREPLAAEREVTKQTVVAAPSVPIARSTRSEPSQLERKALDEDEDDEDLDEPTALFALDNRTRYSALVMPWQNADGAARLTVVVKATFQFRDGEVKAADHQLPVLFGDEHEGGDPLKPLLFEADTAPFKPRADIVLVGKAYTPGGRPRPYVDVRLRVGGLSKRMRIFGDRKWLFPTRLAVVPQVTDPVPFVEMPLTYTRAYGGIDEPAARYCAENLSGVGFIGEPAPASIHNKPLPNLEDPERLIASWDSRPKSVGFGFYSRSWQPRLKYAGTYDEKYRKQASTKTPDDFSYDLYNGAHPDLQVAGYLDGDEIVELENVTRSGSAKFLLPGIRPSISVTRCISGGQSQFKKELPVRPFLDTLVFIPDRGIFYEVFRAVFALRSIDDPDIASIHIA